MAVLPADIAIAAEALNRHPDLSPAARRVGLELLNHTDRKTGLAWPSEARMAEALGVDARTVRRGKAQLMAAGLVTWIRRGTSRKGRTPLYSLVWDRLLNLATDIKAKVQAAYGAARNKIRPTPATSPPSVLKTKDNRPRPSVGRTISPAYLSQILKTSSGKGFWKAQGTPQGQILTDQQLIAKASGRFWVALQKFGPHLMAQLIAHPNVEALEAEAIKAERFKAKDTPDGITGLRTLEALICGVSA